MKSDGEPITKCSVCRYDLTGLPRNHRCPECGFEYDETMRVWRGDYKAPWYWIFVAFFGLLLVVHVTKWLKSGLLLGAGQEFKVLGDILYIILYVSLALLGRPNSYIVATVNGLTYKNPLCSVRFVPWDQIDFPDRAKVPSRLMEGTRRHLFIPIRLIRPRDRGLVYQEIRYRVNTHGNPDSQKLPASVS
ncbi:MAG: hypothetical protein Q7R41_09140 [Phycisphaerales bacterium]|nr:hypothetical protein [Phycisphaerales bacterium]